jgi:peptidyl-tRNA hydrolase, PTH1 family
MWLVAGLGNPGVKYERNRHNIGFLAADIVAAGRGASAWQKKFSGEIGEVRGTRDEGRIFILKPQTFMNLSGESVAAAARFYKIPPEQIIVLYDDLDLLPGKIRVRQGGGNGGHNGLKSIDAHIGKDYWRVRIGIGRPEHKDDVTNYVLGDFGKAEWAVQEKILEAIAQHFGMMLAGDAAGFMNKVSLECRVRSSESGVQ